MKNDFRADIDAIGRIAAVPAILDIVCRTTGMGFAAVARVTDDRWIACRVLDNNDFGLETGDELAVETTICNEIRQHRETVAIDHVAGAPLFRDHPTPAMYGFQSYISTPIILQDGTFFGTLCALDPRPAHVDNPETIGTLKLFAELIAQHLDAGRQLAASQARLLDERAASELREQFIAVMGHDLRNPLASVQAGIRRLSRGVSEDQAKATLGLMQKSVDRMANLIMNVMDFARGRLGGGVLVDRNVDEPLEPVLVQIVEELRANWPERLIEAEFRIREPVASDHARMGQLLSNLLSNALTHGAVDGIVHVHAWTENDTFMLSVANSGEPISAAAMPRLFEPFTRESGGHGKEGLGLGLYIASQIATAHSGKLTVTSSPDETCFTLCMPRY